ncbi:MAG TPA: GDSL-type esterase/lipase family protein, partial [Polyangiaceae bacterium]
RHLRLTFNGRELFAAAAQGTTLLRGRPLGSDWTALGEGDELRFGFALLRVGGEPPLARGSEPARRFDRARVAWGVGGALLLLLALLVVGLVSKGHHSSAAGAGASASAAAPSASSATAPAVVPAEPVPAEPVPAEPALPLPLPVEAAPAEVAMPLPLEREGEATLLNPGAAAAPAKPLVAYPQNIANRPIPRIGDQPWLISDTWREHHERLLRAAGRATAKVIFLGDSITAGWWSAPAYKEYFGKYSPLNLGIVSDTTQNVLWRIEHGALDGTHPQVVVTMVGVNNLAGGFSAQDTASGVGAIVASVQRRLPEARVLLLGVLPARQEASNPLRQRIQDCNRLLQGFAKPGRVEVLDVGAVLLEPDGSIAKTTLRDYLHPTPEGYEKLSRAIAPKLEGLLGG